MNQKIRLVGGPFGGKVMDDYKLYGRNEVIITGPKKMTRKQKYEWMTDPSNHGYMPSPFPHETALYKVALRHHVAANNVPGDGFYAAGQLPCMHPDGSLFYEYVEGSRRRIS